MNDFTSTKTTPIETGILDILQRCREAGRPVDGLRVQFGRDDRGVLWSVSVKVEPYRYVVGVGRNLETAVGRLLHSLKEGTYDDRG